MEQKELQEILSGLRSRGAIKRFGQQADRDPDVRAAMLALAATRGLSVPDTMSGKKLTRLLLDRTDGAQVRRNPIHRDEAFRCAWCGADVAPGGVPVRDHCPRCLRSLHVDQVPGDRANPCQGVLHPSRFALSEGVLHIHYTCGACGGHHRVRSHPDDAVPPSLNPADLPGRPRPENDRIRTLPRRVLGFVRQHHLWAPGDRVTVAVSGGADSTAMLEILAQTAPAHGGQLEVVSIDHGLRAASAAEVLHVQAQAQRLGLPFWTTSLQIPPGPNLYARARDARRAALLSRQADRIATAHHETDQAETVLYHLLRGSGTRGLRGMVPLAAPWCRPLLGEPRALIEAWLRQQDIPWVEDPSNAVSQRGALRKLMPVLDGIHGGAASALARSGRLLARDDDFLSEAAAAAWARAVAPGGLRMDVVRGEHPAIQLRLLQRLTASCPRPVRADQLEAFLDWAPNNGARLQLPAGWALVFRAGIISAHSPSRSASVPTQETTE